jgi:hypothetical protein
LLSFLFWFSQITNLYISHQGIIISFLHSTSNDGYMWSVGDSEWPPPASRTSAVSHQRERSWPPPPFGKGRDLLEGPE